MDSKPQERKRLFEEGQRSRHAIMPDATGYQCPVCWKEFSEEAIGDGRLTIDHVPQQTLKASVLVLTCKHCNNTFGSRYQADTAHISNIAKLRSGEYQEPRHLPAKVVVKGMDSFNAHVWNDPQGRLVIQGSVKNNNPDVVGRWKDNGSFAIPTSDVAVYIKGTVNNSTIERVLLRDAYLLAFHFLGYPYICMELVQDVRRIIAEDMQVTAGAIWRLPDLRITANPGLGQFLWVQHPPELACLLVPLDVPSLGRRHVVLPFFPWQQSFQALCTAWVQINAANTSSEFSLMRASVTSEAKYNCRLIPIQVSDEEVELRSFID